MCIRFVLFEASGEVAQEIVQSSNFCVVPCFTSYFFSTNFTSLSRVNSYRVPLLIVQTMKLLTSKEFTKPMSIVCWTSTIEHHVWLLNWFALHDTGLCIELFLLPSLTESNL
jgi:hypothetical protein